MGPRLLGETIQSWLSAKAKLQICFPFHSNPGYETPGGFHIRAIALTKSSQQLLFFSWRPDHQ